MACNEKLANRTREIIFVIDVESVSISASFQTDEETFNKLLERNSSKPAPYPAKHKWVLSIASKEYQKKNDKILFVHHMN